MTTKSIKPLMPVAVTTVETSRGSIERRFLASIEPHLTVSLAFRVGGYVDELMMTQDLRVCCSKVTLSKEMQRWRTSEPMTMSRIRHLQMRAALRRGRHSQSLLLVGATI